MNKHLEAAISAAREGGKIALRYYRGQFNVELKADRSPVTEADRLAEARIVECLQDLFPAYGILGEEGARVGERGGTRWIIDPIDGTRNFVRGIPYWAVMIGLEEAGEVTVGVIYAPALGDLYYAARGEGAFAKRKRVGVSRVGKLADSLMLHGSLKLMRATPYWVGFVRLVDATERQRGFGDYFGYIFVGDGRAEMMVEADAKPWDLAPVKIWIEEAGGRFTDFTGEPTIYGGNALASNGLVHEEALTLLGGR